MEKFYLEAKVAYEQTGSRLDQVAAALFPSYSRARLQLWIKEGKLLVDGNKAQNKQKLLDQLIFFLKGSFESFGR